MFNWLVGYFINPSCRNVFKARTISGSTYQPSKLALFSELIRLEVPFQIIGWGHGKLFRFRQRPELRGEIVGNNRWPGCATPVNIFPDNLAIRFYLKKSALVVLGNERIAVRKPLLASHGLAEKLDVCITFGFIYPDDFLSYRIHLYDERLSGMGSMPGKEAIVKEDDIAGPGQPLLYHFRFVAVGHAALVGMRALPDNLFSLVPISKFATPSSAPISCGLFSVFL